MKRQGTYRDMPQGRKTIARRHRKKQGRAGMLLFFCAFLAGTTAAVFFHKQDREQELQFEELARMEEQAGECIKADGEGSKASPLPLMDNPDCIGWVKIEGTTVSYPVMQRTGDGDYYLYRDYKGEQSWYGTPFLDIRCTVDSDNRIIYGHNINGNKMFGALHAYAEESYYRKHPDIQVRFGNETDTYQVVAVIATSVSDQIYDFTAVGNREEYREYVGQILEQSLYRTDLGEEIMERLNRDLTGQFFRKYRFVTLSTCRSWAGKDARLLVVGCRERINYLPHFEENE